MKKLLVSGVRRALPAGVVQRLEAAYQKGRAQLVGVKYGNPARDVQLVVVAGATGKATTARFINEMLQEAGRKTSLLVRDDGRPFGADAFQAFLKDAKQQNAGYAVVALSGDDVRAHSLGLIQPDLVIVTNTASWDDVQVAETLLRSKPRFIVLNRDDESYDDLSPFAAGEQAITYGMHDEAEAKMTNLAFYKKGSEASLVIDHQTGITLATYLVGKANAYNMVAAAAGMYVMGEPIQHLDEGAARLERSAGNFEYVSTDTPYSVAIDSAPNETALLSVVESAASIKRRRLILVTQANLLSESSREVLQKQSDRIIVVGEEAPWENVEAVPTRETAVEHALRAARKDDLVLLAGGKFADPADNPTAFAKNVITTALQDS